MSANDDRISDEMGGLLWRRVYAARAGMEPHVPPMLVETLESLLRQAGVTEPEDKGDWTAVSAGFRSTHTDAGAEFDQADDYRTQQVKFANDRSTHTEREER